MHQRIPLNISSLIYISKTEINKNYKATLHSHPNLEILYIIDGEGFIETTNKKIPVKKEDLVFINPNSNHQEISNKHLSFFAIGLNKMEIFSKEKFTKKIITKNDSNFYYLYETIYNEALSKKEKYDLIINNCLDNILIYLERNMNLLINTSSNSESDLISNIKYVIDNNFSLNIKLKDIASRFSTSVSSISHQYKKETNMTIIEYKLNKQLEEAYNLINVSNMTISQIAYSVGFNNQSYFNKMFKKKYYYSPKQMRLSTRNIK